ncbi:MAG: NYN domain-containing protein [Syntrophales bacterium]
MTKRVCIFVDGENFRHSIHELFADIPTLDEYLPKEAQWTEFFDWLVVQAAPIAAERLRTYWYVVQHIDYRPYRIESSRLGAGELQRVLSRHFPFKKDLEGLESEALVDKMKEQVKTLTTRQDIMRKRSDGWINIQDGITNKHNSIEFRRAGSITFDLYKQQFQKEKAVDVKLATDLIVLNGIYDIAVIVSGDQDYVPAVQAVKDWGKKIVNVAFKTKNDKLLPGGARRLNQVTDWSIEISYDQLKEYLCI